MILRKVFQFRMEPTAQQSELLKRSAGARRFVWNWALAECSAHYQKTGKMLPWAELSRHLTALKQQPETAWLREVNAQALQQTLADLRRAYNNFFEKRARVPRFKSRKRDQSRFRIPQRIKIADGRVFIPKIGLVRIRQSQIVEGVTKSATFKQDATGNWYVSVLAEFEMPDIPLLPANPAAVAGVDLGLHDFAVLSDGEREPAPKFFRQAERKLRHAQRVLSRRSKQSKRRIKAKHKVALIQRRTANRRADFLHNLSTELVKRYDGIAIEDLSVRGLARTKLAKSIVDASFGEFRRQLQYKAIWNRRHLAVIDRFFPSSKLCHVCGVINDALTLKDRSWTCVCGVRHDRDLNAAINIRYEGLKLIPVAEGHSETLNARGLDVRLPHQEAIGVESRIPRL